MGLFDPQIATTQSSLSYDPDLQSAFKNLLTQSQGIAGIGYQGYGGPRLAGLSPEQQQFVQQAPSSLNPALSYANMNGSDALAQFGNPFQQSVIDASKKDINRQYDISGQGVAANAALNGQVDSFGDRSQILQAENERNRNDTMARTVAGLNTQNYGQSMGMAANRATQLAGLSQQQMANLASAGQMNQNQTQQQYNIDYGNFLEQRGWPQQQASWLMSQLQGAPRNYSQTQQQLGPSVGAGIAGLGIAGAGLLPMLGSAASGIGKLFSGNDSGSTATGTGAGGTGYTDWSTPSAGDFGSVDYGPFARGGIARGYAGGGAPSPDSPSWADRKAYWDAQAQGRVGRPQQTVTVPIQNAMPQPAMPSNGSEYGGNQLGGGNPSPFSVDLDRLIKGGAGAVGNAATSGLGWLGQNVGMPAARGLNAAVDYFGRPTGAEPTQLPQSPREAMVPPTAISPTTTPTPTPQQAGIAPAAADAGGGGDELRTGQATLPNGGAMAAAQEQPQAGIIKPPPATPMPPKPQAGVAPQPAVSADPAAAGPAPGGGEQQVEPATKLEATAQKALKAAAPPDSDTKSDIPEWAMPLASAGFAMMASKSPFILNAVGEGGLAGLAAYNKRREEDIKNKLAERQVSTSERAQTETGRHNVETETTSRVVAEKQLTNAEKQLDLAKKQYELAKQRGEKEDTLMPAKEKLLNAQAGYYNAKAGAAGGGGAVNDKVRARAMWLMQNDPELEPEDAIKQAMGKDVGAGTGQARVDTTQQHNRASFIRESRKDMMATLGRPLKPAESAAITADADEQYPLQPGGPKKVEPTATPLPDTALKQLKAGVVTTFGNGQKWTLGKNGQAQQVTQ